MMMSNTDWCADQEGEAELKNDVVGRDPAEIWTSYADMTEEGRVSRHWGDAPAQSRTT